MIITINPAHFFNWHFDKFLFELSSYIANLMLRFLYQQTIRSNASTNKQSRTSNT